MKLIIKLLIVLVPILLFLIIKYSPLILVYLFAEKAEKQSNLIQSTESFLEERYNKKFKVLTIGPTNLYGRYEGRVMSQEKIYFNVYEEKMKDGLDIQNDYYLKLWGATLLEKFLQSNEGVIYELEFGSPDPWLDRREVNYWDEVFISNPKDISLNLNIFSEKRLSQMQVYSLIQEFQRKNISSLYIYLNLLNKSPSMNDLNSQGSQKYYEENEANISRCAIGNYKLISRIEDLKISNCIKPK